MNYSDSKSYTKGGNIRIVYRNWEVAAMKEIVVSIWSSFETARAGKQWFQWELDCASPAIKGEAEAPGTSTLQWC